MSVCCFLYIFIFILLHYLPTYLSDTSKDPVSGPYRTMIVAATSCEVPTRPYMKDPPMTFKPVVHNTSTAILMSGNITVIRDTKNTKYRMKSFIWEDGSWNPYFMMNDISCHSMLLNLMCTASGIKYDRKNCLFFKGQYGFKNMDVNSLQHLWASKMKYGRLLWRFEVFHPKHGTYFCYDYETVTEPV